jgi:spermidine synthase/S-adenosylmethionine decarboxylase
MNGLHLIADLLDCRCPADFLFAAPHLEAFCTAACAKNGLTVVGRLFHTFHDAAGNPAGVTGTVVLAESHLAVHTWPEMAGVTLDVYVCNFSADNNDRAHALFADVIAAFAPQRLETKEVVRGCLLAPRPA